MSPKDKMDKVLLKIVARGMDKFYNAVQHGKQSLHLNDDLSSRITHVENEIVKWRSVLRESKYLKGKSTANLRSMDGKELNPILNNFSSNAEKKVKHYFKLAEAFELETLGIKI